MSADGDEVDARDAATDEDVRTRSRLARDRSMVEHGRRMAGAPGAMMAGAMIALRDIYEAPKDDQIVAVSETPDEPHDVDRDGVTLSADELGGADDVSVDAQPRRQPVMPARRSSRRR
ncbi:MAG: hypothetical protein H0W46_01700 [Acidimicrobiia bacterium]|nr:hypothetical protein [Acidimicrobiia bacterium]